MGKNFCVDGDLNEGMVLFIYVHVQKNQEFMKMSCNTF